MDVEVGITRQQEQIEQQEQERQKPSLTLEQIKQQYDIITSSSEVPADDSIDYDRPSYFVALFAENLKESDDEVDLVIICTSFLLARDWLADCGLCALVVSLVRAGPSSFYFYYFDFDFIDLIYQNITYPLASFFSKLVALQIHNDSALY